MAHFLQSFARTADHRAVGQALRYGIAAGVGYVLAMVLYAAEIGIGVAPYPAVIIAFVLNGIFNFTVIRRWAFPTSGRSLQSDFTRFCVVAAGSLIINYASFALFYSVIGLPAIPAQAMAIVMAAPFGFLANRLWSFHAA